MQVLGFLGRSMRMTVAVSLVLSSGSMIFPREVQAAENACRALFASHPASQMPRGMIAKIIEQLKRPGSGLRLLAWNGSPRVPKGNRDHADPTRPIRITLPDGSKRWFIGLSGQNYILVKNLAELTRGGKIKVQKLRLFNENGHPYGEDVRDGQAIDYSGSSGTWDAELFVQENGKMHIFAGAMDSYESGPFAGQPMMIEGNNTRRRRTWTASFEERFDPNTGERSFELVGREPKDIFNYTSPKDDSWRVVDPKTGNVIFAHGYGGGPLLMGNGKPYRDQNGNYVMYHEAVIEEGREVEPSGHVRKTPYRTAVLKTVIDPKTMKAVGESTLVMDVTNADGKIYPSTERLLNPGQLAEGPHVDVLDANGVPFKSREAYQRALRNGEPVLFRMAFSSGDFWSVYGANTSYSGEGGDRFRVIENVRGDMDNMLEPLRRILTWTGRPVLFRDRETNRDYLMFHGVPRTAIREGVELDVHPGENFVELNQRALLIVPVKRVEFVVGGMKAWKYEIDDPKLLKLLEQYELPPVPGRTADGHVDRRPQSAGDAA